MRAPSLSLQGHALSVVIGREAAMRANGFLTLAVVLMACLSCRQQAHAAAVDAAIVFAVDFSSSIDPDTADLQRKGHAAALTSPEILAAIARNYRRCIAVTYFEWSSPGRARIVLPWTRICGRDDAETAARIISDRGDTGREPRARAGTSISSAIDVGRLLLDQFPGTADRKVIDISGNGENNDGLPVGPSRSSALAEGLTINAIAIPAKDEVPGCALAAYFAENVIGGPQAFVMSPTGPGDYAMALRRKLVTEVSMNAGP
jgi:hypothetical protein